MLMPAMGTLDDAQLAAILSYIRTAWGHKASQISPETIRKVRTKSLERNGPWTRDELARLRDAQH
jgi:mono/diheme cytochrome c family protein